MLIFDQLRKNDRRLQLLAVSILSGLGVLLAGLWFVQVVSAKRFQASQVSQSFRIVRIPAIRGKILDANGVPLADNRPSYNINLYLEELRPYFQTAFSNTLKSVRQQTAASGGRTALTSRERIELGRQSRYRVISNLVTQVGSYVQQPLISDPKEFQKKFLDHYDQRLFLPMPLLKDLTQQQISLFVEQTGNLPGTEVDAVPVRTYPQGNIAAHLLGCLSRDDAPTDEDTFYNYRMPDFKGVTGVEGAFDSELRGKTGVKSVLVNSLGFRQAENIWTPPEAGQNVILTIDLSIQQVAEKALRSSLYGVSTRGAAVVMDARNGDLLAVASNPTFDPNHFIRGFTHAEWEGMIDPIQLPQINRATAGAYLPGSIFKIVVGIAGLEAGLDPKNKIVNPPDPADYAHGHVFVGRHKFKDLAPPGEYDFRRALIKSSNTYFIIEGLKVGVDGILEIGKRLHFGEKTGIPTRQDEPGNFPTREWQQAKLGGAWFDGNTANLCIGQGEIDVTPLQIAVMVAAVANGGTVFWPRLVARVEPQDPYGGDQPVVFSTRVRDHLNLKKRTFDTIREAMHGDVQDSEGTGRKALVPGMGICAKTGTAQRKQNRRLVGHNTWFASFAPYENPRYVVVVMVEEGASGGDTCAPLAQQIYLALQKRDLSPQRKPEALASRN
jgi:penicillin-binding protein 2